MFFMLVAFESFRQGKAVPEPRLGIFKAGECEWLS